MSDFHYVYILVSEKYPEKHYTGLTTELPARLKSIIMEKSNILQNSNLGELRRQSPLKAEIRLQSLSLISPLPKGIEIAAPYRAREDKKDSREDHPGVSCCHS